MVAGLKLVGPYPRVKQILSASNALRWEVDWALGTGTNRDGPHNPHKVDEIAVPLGEAIALQRVALETIQANAHLLTPGPLFGTFNEAFVRSMDWNYEYHQTPR